MRLCVGETGNKAMCRGDWGQGYVQWRLGTRLCVGETGNEAVSRADWERGYV